MPMLALGFLTPWLMAAGGAATSIPIIIHLLNKRKFRIVIWAAMEWLLAAQRRNARRLKFQRWLLLLIRCLAILIIAAGIAQMVLQNTAIGSLLGEQHAVVIIWDDSYSMGYQQNAAGAADANATAFEKSRRLITDYIDQLKSGDTVLVIRGSAGGAAEVTGLKPSADHQFVKDQVRAARITDAATDLPTAFDAARQALTDIQQGTRFRQLLLVTDFSNSSIHDPRRGNGGGAENVIEGVAGDKLKKAALGAIAHATDFHIVDVGIEQQTNTAITALAPKRPVVVVGVPADFRVEVFNASERQQLDVPVSILVDGVPAASVRIPRIDPANFQSAEITATVTTPGRHLVEARLPGDSLPVDDARRLMLNVRKEIPILLVDGSPGDGGRTSYGSMFYLNAAYAIPVVGKTAGMFAPRIVSELELPTTPLASYDVVVLSDTSDPGPAMREALQKFVADGGLLMLFPGPRTNTQRMNEALGESGANLLPATLGQTMKPGTDQLADGTAFDPENYLKNPVLQVFAADYQAGKEVGLLTVQTMQYFKLGVPTDGSSEVVLRYSDKTGATNPAAPASSARGDAAVVLRRGVGADPVKGTPGGTVVLFASTADMAWNTWGAKASYLPFMHELTFYGMSRATLNAGAGLTLDVGNTLHLPGDIASAGPWTGPHDLRFNVTQEVKDGHAILSGPVLKESGVYGPATGDPRPVLAVNPQTREADIRRVSKDAMAAALGTDVASVVQNPAALLLQKSSSAEGASLGAWLVLAALALFIVESILALAFSTYR